MTHYVGLDVSQRTTAVCQVFAGRVQTNAACLEALLRPGCPDPVSRPLRHTAPDRLRADVLATMASYAATPGAW